MCDSRLLAAYDHICILDLTILLHTHTTHTRLPGIITVPLTHAGFHLSLRSGHPCLNLLFDWWTLNTRWKVVLSLILVFAWAVAVEGLAKFRHVTVAQCKLQQQRSSNTTSTNTATIRRYSIPLLHGLQAAAGYTLMLIAMTFSLELLGSVVAGLATGYGIFFKLSPTETSGSDNAGDNDPYQLRQHVTTNPCCEFMEEESKETTITASAGGLRRPPITGFQSNASRGEDDSTLILEGAEDQAPPRRSRSRSGV